MRTQPKPIVTIVKQQIEELKADAQADQQSSERELEASTRHKESSKRKMIRAAELEKQCEALELQGMTTKEASLHILFKNARKKEAEKKQA